MIDLCFLQRARDPKYAAMMDAQLNTKGRGRKKATYKSARRRKSEKEDAQGWGDKW